VSRLFIQAVEEKTLPGKGHFSDEGNRWAADAIRAALPELAAPSATLRPSKP
jgi:hypothetical protein